jgi:hypothetical protein
VKEEVECVSRDGNESKDEENLNGESECISESHRFVPLSPPPVVSFYLLEEGGFEQDDPYSVTIEPLLPGHPLASPPSPFQLLMTVSQGHGSVCVAIASCPAGVP